MQMIMIMMINNQISIEVPFMPSSCILCESQGSAVGGSDLGLIAFIFV